jgi:hypothetical protein
MSRSANPLKIDMYQISVNSNFKILKYCIHLDRSRVEANPPHPFTKVEAVAHEDVVDCLEPTQPNPSYNKGFVVESACE